MWKSKKFIVIAALIAVVLVAGTAGMVLAQDGNKGPGPRQALLEKVAQILGIPQQKLEDAFKQANEEARVQREAAFQERLQNLVTEGKLTQKQVDDFKAWQKAKPNVQPQLDEFKAWMKARPELPLPKPNMPRGQKPGFFRGGPGAVPPPSPK